MTTKSLGGTIVKLAAATTLAIGLFALPASADTRNDYRWNQPSQSYHQPNQWGPPTQHWDRHHDNRWNRDNRWDRDSRWHRWIMPFHQVRRELRHHGYRHIDQLDLRRGDYIVRAVNYRGHPVRLRVDGRTGRILDWRYI
jgi:hypothetical protein